MCPCQNGASQPADSSEMVQVPLNGATNVNGTNGANGNTTANGSVNGHANGSTRPFNPYAPRASDFLSNVSNFKIIESTLRGESKCHACSSIGWRTGELMISLCLLFCLCSIRCRLSADC